MTKQAVHTGPYRDGTHLIAAAGASPRLDLIRLDSARLGSIQGLTGVGTLLGAGAGGVAPGRGRLAAFSMKERPSKITPLSI